ncbi:MAG: cobalamin-binding protein [Flavobacterium sp. BFFFF2]|nr:MAG: cobalamin-binding protein [Flavobacterium sp. BFFFF2]
MIHHSNSAPKLAHTPLSVVCLVPSLTETLYDLGLGSSLVGITTFCVFPPQLRGQKVSVGGTKKVNMAKLKKLEPDLVIANQEENTLDMVNELSAFVPVWVTNIATISDCFEVIESMGTLFNKRTESQQWIQKIQYKRSNYLMRFSANHLKVIYFIWAKPYMAAASGTFIHFMLTDIGFVNTLADQTRYPVLEATDIEALDPDLVLLSSEPYEFSDQEAFEIGRYTHHAKTVFVDGTYFSWYGTRMAKSYDYFEQLMTRITNSF